jgi:ubiquitin carboxyl-terminal hydrolase 4/11/15
MGDGTDDPRTAERAWAAYRMRNDSAVVDFFHGQLRSRLICPICCKTTTVFDPYMSLSVPVVRPHARDIDFIFIPFDVADSYTSFRVTVPDGAAQLDLAAVIGRPVNVAIVRCAKTGTTFSYSFGLADDEGFAGQYFALEIPDTRRKYVVGRIRGIDGDLTGPIVVPVAGIPQPSVIVLQQFEEKLARCFDDALDDTSDPYVQNWRSLCGCLERRWGPRERLYLEIIPQTFGLASNQLAVLSKYPFLGNKVVHVFVNPRFVGPRFCGTLQRLSGWRGGVGEARSATRVRMTLDQCFEYFSMAEVLDENNQWFCPHCRTFVCAEKKMDVWSLAQVLVIHLKRFIGGKASPSRKFDGFIEFPNVLDMSRYCIGPQKGTPLKYKLYGVSEHSGGLHGGHYTAHACVTTRDQHSPDGTWCLFNDSTVVQAKAGDAHSEAAYMLFYERIEDGQAGRVDND